MEIVNVGNNKVRLVNRASECLENVLRENMEVPRLLMLSGGSSLGLLEDFDVSMLDSSVTVTVLDERFSSKKEVNNFQKVKETDFYELVHGRGCKFIETVPYDNERLDAFAQRWEKQLREWVEKNPDGIVVATVGMGVDGHVAGISPFPGDEERFKKEFEEHFRWVVGYEGSLMPALRVTVTPEFLRTVVDVAIVFVSGESKQKAWERVMAEEGSLAETPARLLGEMKDVSVFTDLK